MGGLVKRSDKVAFFGVVNGDGVTYHRMKGFTDISVSRNPKEYSRQYVDEEFERTDVVGYATSMAYGFDQHAGDSVHDDIVSIHDNELIGADAVRSIIIVDFTKQENGGAYVARKRDFSVIPDGEGSSMDAYTYSGTLKTAGDTVVGTATSSDSWDTCTFVEGK
ncbi:MAG: hypothetical protein IKU87_02440 [Clostridia bacterium]|nr:hypothetical protein [Clostridia bacterium]